MKKYIVLVTLSMFFILTACNQAKRDEVKMNSKETDTATHEEIYSTQSIFYSDEQLSEIAEYSGLKDELIARYPSEHIRSLSIMQSEKGEPNNQNSVLVSYHGETKALQLIFDSSGNKLFSHIYNMTLSKQDFETLSIGQTLSDVQAIDPNGEYLFLYTGRNDLRVSSHYTTDGFLISITYDMQNLIEKIDIEPT